MTLFSKLSAAQRLAVVLGPALVVLSMGLLAYGGIQRTTADMERVFRAHQVSLSLDDLVERVVAAETAQRGYIITGQERFLEPYHGVRGDVHAQVDSLRHLILDPTQHMRLEGLAPVIEAKLEHMERNVVLARAGDFAGAQASVQSGEGVRSMNAVRQMVDEMQQVQAQVIAARTMNAQTRARYVGFAVLLGALLAVCLAVLTTLLLARHARAQEALARAVEDRNVQFQDQARALKVSNQELQQANRALRERDAEHTALLESAGDGIYGIDLEGRCTFINRRGAELLGYSVEEVLGEHMHDLIHHHRPDGSEYPEEDCPIYQAGRCAEGVGVEDEVLWRKDGTPFPAEYASFPLLGNGRSAGAVVTFRDITDRKRLEEERLTLLDRERALRRQAEESEQQFRMMANFILQLAWTADETGSIFWYNERWFDYTGTTLEEMQGWGWQKAHHPEHVERVVERIRHAFAAGEPWEDTFPLRSRTGEYRWFLSRALPIRDAEGRVVRWFGTNTDITERLESERARYRALQETEAARAEAEEANRAKMEFLSAMSHELRTPLNAIAGYVDLLNLGVYGNTSAEQLQALDRIRSNQRSLLVLINDILQYAKMEAGRLEFDSRNVPAAELLCELESMIEPQVRTSGLTYAVDACDPELTVLGDPERIRQILLNLLTNAVKFTPSGGHVRLSCESRDQWIEFRVRDTGRGIPAEMVQQIFDPFVQAERYRHESSQQGVGLGLAISRDLAHAMGGDLRVESTLGHGSTFTLSLPSGVGERSGLHQENPSHAE